jgi:hypothetical protein
MQIPRLTPCPMFCALKRRLLDHPEISSNRHAALPDPNVRDRAGGAVVVIDLPVRSHGYGAGELNFVVDPRGQLAVTLRVYRTPAGMGAFGSGAASRLVGLDEFCSTQNPRMGLMIIPQNRARAKLSSSSSP